MPPDSWCGKSVRAPLRVGHAHHTEQLYGAPPACGSRRPEHATRYLGQLVAHRVDRVQPAQRILENHRQAASPSAPGGRAGKRQRLAG